MLRTRVIWSIIWLGDNVGFQQYAAWHFSACVSTFSRSWLNRCLFFADSWQRWKFLLLLHLERFEELNKLKLQSFLTGHLKIPLPPSCLAVCILNVLPVAHFSDVTIWYEGFAEKESFKPGVKEWRGDGWWVDGTDGASATDTTGWGRIGEISAWLREGSRELILETRGSILEGTICYS